MSPKDTEIRKVTASSQQPLNMDGRTLIAEVELLKISAFVNKEGVYEILIVSPADAVIATVGKDEIKAESFYKDLVKRLYETVESEIIFLEEDMKG